MKIKTAQLIKQLIIPDADANVRFDVSLSKLLPEYSRTQVQAWIESGEALLDGQPAKPRTKVRGGEEVTVEATVKEQPAWEAQPIPLNIVHEDESILIINKPPGLVVHPGAGNANSTLLNALLHHAPELQLLPRAGIVHRLDKETSGLLVIAKTPAALKSLTHQIKERSMTREYQCVVYGKFISGGKVDAPIDRHPIHRKRMAVTDDRGREARTGYRVLERLRGATWVEAVLHTGRTHQIRVHFQFLGSPVVGDATYGKVQNQRLTQTSGYTAPRQMLHARKLSFRHPRKAKTLKVEAPLPADFQAALTALRGRA